MAHLTVKVLFSWQPQWLHMWKQKKSKTTPPSTWFPPLIPSPCARYGQTRLKSFLFLGHLDETTTDWEMVKLTTQEPWFLSLVHVLRRCIHWHDAVIKKLIFDYSVIFRDIPIFHDMLMENMIVHVFIVYSASTRMEVNNKCHLVFSSEVRSSAHHFWDIKGSRIFVDDADEANNDAWLLTSIAKSWVVWFRRFEKKNLLQQCMCLFNRSIKSWNPWQPSRKTILPENQISSSVLAAWSRMHHQPKTLEGLQPCISVLSSYPSWNH